MRILTIVFTCLLVAVPCHADIIIVDDDGVADFNTIQAAIDYSSDGDVIIVQPGLYQENINFGGKNIILTGTNPVNRAVVDETIIDADGSGPVVTFSGEESPDCVLSGFTITNGAGYCTGGGIRGNGASATIQYNVISGNRAYPPLPIPIGGGLGGGLCNCDGIIRNNIISNNEAENSLNGIGRGGGLFNCNGIIESNIIFGNSAGSGGGLAYCNAVIRNCIITGNKARWGSGGGIASVTSIISNCTIADNTAYTGGGIHVHIAHVGSGGGHTTILNSVLWGNNAERGDDVALVGPEVGKQLGPAILDVNYCNIRGGRQRIYVYDDYILNWGPGNIDADPCFVQPGYWVHKDDPDIILEPNDVNAVWNNGDYHLSLDSPCIDTGDPCFVPEPNETDLDGKPRIIGPFVDMGAYEFNYIPIADAGPNQVVTSGPNGIAIVTLDSSGSYDGDDHDLTYLWSWSVDGNDFNSTEPNAIIELPIGRHKITLVVNDGIEDSEPDTVLIEVVWPPLRTDLRIYPKTIVRHNRAKWIFAVIKLPPRIRPQMINWQRPLLLLPGRIEAIWKHVFRRGRGKDKCTYILVVFEKAQLMQAVPQNGTVPVRVVGFLKNGRRFIGRDIIRIISPRRAPGLKPKK
jgi:hypothetical protein